jgi:hypothetical protein
VLPPAMHPVTRCQRREGRPRRDAAVCGCMAGSCCWYAGTPRAVRVQLVAPALVVALPTKATLGRLTSLIGKGRQLEVVA